MNRYKIMLSLLWINTVYAGPFDKAESKSQELYEFLKGNLALIVMSIVITVTGMLLWFNKVKPDVGIRIIAGAIVVGSSATLAQWALN